MGFFMVVKNANNAPSIGTCGCGTWLTHWRRYGKPSAGFRLAATCAVVVCERPIETAVPVQKDVLEGLQALGRGDASWYIVPVCRGCASRKGARLIVEEDCGLVPAQVLETCGRDDAEQTSRLA